MTKKYIDFDDVLEQLFYLYDSISPNTLTGNDARIKILQSYKTIENLPAADMQEVRHGKWIDTEPKYNYENHCAAHYQCSECGRRTGIKQTRTYKYCPRCGARMEGENNE